MGYFDIINFMLYYITSNQDKIRVAKKYLSPFEIIFEGKDMELFEKQSDDIREIAIEKAKQAYAVIKQPLFVNDAGWHITALNGFPGSFMKFVNGWLTAEDILNLMSPHTNREVILREVVCYIDDTKIKPFIGEKKGIVLHTNTDSTDIPSRSIISLSSTGKSISECWKEGIPPAEDYPVWQEFGKWYSNNLQCVMI